MSWLQGLDPARFSPLPSRRSRLRRVADLAEARAGHLRHLAWMAEDCGSVAEYRHALARYEAAGDRAEALAALADRERGGA